MEDSDRDSGVEGYLYEPERADFPNIQNNLTDDDSSDSEGECFGIFCDGRTKMQRMSRAWCMARIISTNAVMSAICWSGGKMVAFKLSTSHVIS